MPLSGNLALQNAIAKIKIICDKSEGRSQFFPFGGSGYKASVTHYFNSSTEISACAVQPGSVEDLQSIKNNMSLPRLQVKCGGHSTNPGFSSTEGIQIYLVRFNKITIDTEKKFVHVEAGCLFEELYRALAPHKLNIVGGSGLAGVGVTGWVLGGGYSTKTSQYGLGIDNVESAKLVLPNGDFKEVSAVKDKELFYAIKGGGNNFGIITEFTLNAHDQGKYYDFLLTYKAQHQKAVKDAIAKSVGGADNRANFEAAFRHHSNPNGIESFLTVHCVYDGDFPKDDPFKELRAIEHTIDNYGDPLPEQKTPPGPFSEPEESDTSPGISAFYVADTLRSLENETYDLGELPEELGDHKTNAVKYNVPMSFIKNIVGDIKQWTAYDDKSFRRRWFTTTCIREAQATDGRLCLRSWMTVSFSGRWGNVMVDEFTPGIIDEIEKQSIEASKEIVKYGGTRVVIGLWPFTKAMFTKAKPSAWPHETNKPNCPIIVYFTWEGKENDAYWIPKMQETLGTLRAKVHVERPSAKGLPYFISTALAEGTKVEDLYRGNLDELKQLRKKYDPHGVMDLTGGFKIPLPVSGQ
ncbi:hypothetical protein J3R83DRAFT_4496 [Lanmaoa asiatica]|nr:hypothetical protein J3R83DRAFT_4496 [Lanmaoa asiatica]